jgi:hypothetical protein
MLLSRSVSSTLVPLYHLNSDIRSISNKDSSVTFERVEHNVPGLAIVSHRLGHCRSDVVLSRYVGPVLCIHRVCEVEKMLLSRSVSRVCKFNPTLPFKQ